MEFCSRVPCKIFTCRIRAPARVPLVLSYDTEIFAAAKCDEKGKKEGEGGQCTRARSYLKRESANTVFTRYICFLPSRFSPPFISPVNKHVIHPSRAHRFAYCNGLRLRAVPSYTDTQLATRSRISAPSTSPLRDIRCAARASLSARRFLARPSDTLVRFRAMMV